MGALKMKPRDSMPTTTSTLVSANGSTSRSIASANGLGCLMSVVMS